jgi:hypothetical protein
LAATTRARRLFLPDSLGDELQPELVTALPVQRSSAAGPGEPAVHRQRDRSTRGQRTTRAIARTVAAAPSDERGLCVPIGRVARVRFGADNGL